jgi:Ricin-type beta-trefoil lectin domain-like
MTPVRIGKPQTPYLVRGLEGAFDVLFALLLGKGTDLLLETEKHEPGSVTIVNKFSGKALEVENSSVRQGARIEQVTLSGAASQRWFVKLTKFIRCRTMPSTIGRQAQRFWAAFLRFPAAGYSLIADHSGLCLDIPNGSMDIAVAVQQFPLNGGSSHLWGFVPDDTGFNFIVNLKSGLVLDVGDNSLKNYATVWQYPFNGGDSQRWQLLK